ncbi:MAG: hypothetical protein WCQ57_14320 [Verrucomicrobiota bacterium]
MKGIKSTRISDALLINFGSYKFQIKKYILKPTDGGPLPSNSSL